MALYAAKSFAGSERYYMAFGAESIGLSLLYSDELFSAVVLPVPLGVIKLNRNGKVNFAVDVSSAFRVGRLLLNGNRLSFAGPYMYFQKELRTGLLGVTSLGVPIIDNIASLDHEIVHVIQYDQLAALTPYSTSWKYHVQVPYSYSLRYLTSRLDYKNQPMEAEALALSSN